jgi:hypothetical protein
MVYGKVMDWFDYRGSFLFVFSLHPQNLDRNSEFKAWKWLRAQTVDRITQKSASKETSVEDVWKERREAVTALQNYISDPPSDGVPQVFVCNR